MDGWTRLLIVGGAVAVVTWFAWPYVRGEMSEVGRQVGEMNHSGIAPWDPFGLMPRQDRADRGGRVRLPEGVGNARGDREERSPDRQGRGYEGYTYHPDRPRKWRLCRDDGSSCGPWQDGPAPSYGRR
jgi:hypothetical protein